MQEKLIRAQKLTTLSAHISNGTFWHNFVVCKSAGDKTPALKSKFYAQFGAFAELG
jgi:hypothetical protein